MANLSGDHKKILITGAGGFIGRFLGNYLQAGSFAGISPEIVLTYRILPEKAQPSCKMFGVGNIDGATRWDDVLADVDIVIHLAARVHVMRETNADPLQAFRDVNTQGTLNLAKQAALAGVKRFIYLSSIKVNGEKTQDQPFYADDIPNPQNPYAISKFEAEQQLLQLAEKTGLEVVIIRPPLVYGFGVKGNFSRLVNVVKKSIPLPFKGINNKRSLVSLQNLCSLIEVCLIHPNAVGQIFLVSDGDDLSTSQLLAEIARAIGRRGKMFYFPKFLIKFLAYSLGFRAEFDRLYDSLQVDVGKNELLLDWKPKFSVENGIRKAVEVV